MVDTYVVYNTNYTPEMWWLVQCVTCSTVHGTFAMHFQAALSTPPKNEPLIQRIKSPSTPNREPSLRNLNCHQEESSAALHAGINMVLLPHQAKPWLIWAEP